jgi:ribosomal protein S18 acetylase RimI-like enzyme
MAEAEKRGDTNATEKHTMTDKTESRCIRQLQAGDAKALAEFYNGLSERSRLLFRPLGWQTTVDACAAIIEGNQSQTATKYDLVATHDTEIVGWCFVWDLDSERPNLGLGIADKCHGRGIGSTLLDRVLSAVRAIGLLRVYLIVVQDNHVAYRLYASRGFTCYGEFVGDDGLAYYEMVATL